MSAIRKTEADYHELAHNRGLEWVGRYPGRTSIKTLWRCEKGHEWKAQYSNIYMGTGCPICYRTTGEDYHLLGADRGIYWAGEILPFSRSSLTLWNCEKGHEWKARYNNIYQGTGCPFCSGKARKTEQNYHDLAYERGVLWTGQELPKNVQTKTLWQCQDGHTWETTYSIIRNGCGCPYCAKVVKKTEADYHSIGADRGLRWIGQELPKNTAFKTLWQCQDDHTWDAPYSMIQQGSGCPRCASFLNGTRVSRPQLKLAEMLGIPEEHVNYKVGTKRIDMILFDLGVGIEYDSWYWHKDSLADDRARVEFLRGQGWPILSIKTDNMLPALEQLQEAIKVVVNTKNNYDLVMPDWGS